MKHYAFFGCTLLLAALPLRAEACAPSGNEGGIAVYRVGAGCACSTVQQAVNAIGFEGEGIVRIRSGDFNESLYIFNRSVSLIGGHESCTAPAPSNQQSTITALGLNEQVVGFHVTTGTRALSLVNLRLTEGDGQEGLERPFPGGGLSVTTGAGAVSETTLDHTIVSGNRSAFRGGGVALTGAGQGTFGAFNRSAIAYNQVTGADPKGGGLYCQGNYDILMVGGSMLSNRAGPAFSTQGLGGGIYVDACNLSWFSGPGSVRDDGLFNLTGNAAGQGGGGLFAAGGSQVRLSGSHFILFGDPQSTLPFAVNHNSARQGGAIWAVGPSTRVSLDRAWTTRNSVVGSGSLFFAQNAIIRFERASAVCHHRDHCSRIFDNTSGNSVFRIDSASGRVELSRTIVWDNRAFDANNFVTSLFNLQYGGRVLVEDSLIHGNVAGDLFFATSTLPPQVWVLRSTIAANGSSGRVFRLGPTANFRLWDSIVHEPGRIIALGFEDATLSIECVVWHDDRMGGIRTLVADPQFLDPEAGQFYLRDTSPAINFCPFAPPAPAVDLEWNPRGICHGSSGGCGADVYDLGAFEFPLRIFRDRFQLP